MEVKAAVAHEARKPLQIETVQLEGPKAGEVLVEIKATGVCHTDEFTLSGADPEGLFPAVLGHEGAGVVEEVGEGVSLVPGSRVMLSWLPACGRCDECQRGLGHLCAIAWEGMASGGLLDGRPRLSRDGEPVHHYSFLSTFAERAVVPAACCIPIPDGVPFEIASIA
jgi:S-(hydroxymethyl)glutathione dehydrogenase/alcohol dehydrogenase